MTVKKEAPVEQGEVQEIMDFGAMMDGMTEYVNGVQWDAPLPVGEADPDPFPPGDEADVYKTEATLKVDKTKVQV